MKKQTTKLLRSSCCGAKFTVVGKTTRHYECRKCHKRCDIVLTAKAIEIMDNEVDPMAELHLAALNEFGKAKWYKKIYILIKSLFIR